MCRFVYVNNYGETTQMSISKSVFTKVLLNQIFIYVKNFVLKIYYFKSQIPTCCSVQNTIGYGYYDFIE